MKFDEPIYYVIAAESFTCISNWIITDYYALDKKSLD